MDEKLRGETVFPCKNLPNWDWKSGKPHEDVTTSEKFTRNYFDCGVYFFDGTFNVVKFPKGMNLYHGSGILANVVAEFPIGLNYYDTYKMQQGSTNTPIHPKPGSGKLTSVVAASDESIEEIISASFDISAGWFADPSVGRLYSHAGPDQRLNTLCGERCVNVYKLKEDITMFLLDDDYNIAKLFQSPNNIVPPAEKKRLAEIFSIQVPPGKQQPTLTRTNANGPFTRIRYTKTRKSDRTWDLPFAKFLCEHVVKKLQYSGYGATSQHSGENHGGQFHMEFVFCNAFKWMTRDLENPLDWQHNPNSPNDQTLRIFMQQLGLYQSTNVNFHAGDLLQHSIWCLLFTEYIMKHGGVQMPNIPNKKELAKVTAFTGFIHDIGKMSGGVKKNDKTKKFIYFSIPTHPIIGSDYIGGVKKMPIFNTDLVQTGELNIDELFDKFGIDKSYKVLVAIVIHLHWEIGPIIGQYNSDTDPKQVKLQKYSGLYLQKVAQIAKQAGITNPLQFQKIVYALVVVSLADIDAAQVFGFDRLKKANGVIDELNKRSEYFPFITNVPRKYRGGNLGEILGINTNGVELGNYCINRALSDFK
jgi:hypothetical protein